MMTNAYNTVGPRRTSRRFCSPIGDQAEHETTGTGVAQQLPKTVFSRQKKSSYRSSPKTVYVRSYRDATAEVPSSDLDSYPTCLPWNRRATFTRRPGSQVGRRNRLPLFVSAPTGHVCNIIEGREKTRSPFVRQAHVGLSVFRCRRQPNHLGPRHSEGKKAMTQPQAMRKHNDCAH